MFPSIPPFILIPALLQGAAVMEQPVVAACENLQHIDLTLRPEASWEICVSPGNRTSFHFGEPVTVELQDELRFEAVVRGPQLFTLVPPANMESGERLRLTVRVSGGTTPWSATFTLVAHPGQATRQVEVRRDGTLREAFQQELAQEREKSHRLREENQELRILLERSQDLRSLLANKKIGPLGILARPLVLDTNRSPAQPLLFVRGLSFRAETAVAAEVWLFNWSAEPWSAAGASLVDATGKESRRMKLRQDGPIQTNTIKPVFVEVEAEPREATGEWMLILWNETRTVTLLQLVFP